MSSANFYKPGPMPRISDTLMTGYLHNEIDKIRRGFEFLGDWQEITPLWTGATTDPVIGNGTLQGWYRRIQDMVFFSGRMVAGSTTTFGSGDWSVSLPASLNVPSVGVWVGSAYGLDQGTGFRAGIAHIANAATTVQIYSDNQASGWRSNIPITWTTDDQMHWSITYKV